MQWTYLQTFVWILEHLIFNKKKCRTEIKLSYTTCSWNYIDSNRNLFLAKCNINFKMSKKRIRTNDMKYIQIKI